MTRKFILPIIFLLFTLIMQSSELYSYTNQKGHQNLIKKKQEKEVISFDTLLENINKTWKQARTNGHYHESTYKELNQCKILFKHILTIKSIIDVKVLTPLCHQLGFEICTIPIPPKNNNESLLILMEKNHQKKGRGFYLFRLKAKYPILIQAPHCGSDRFTGTIALKLFLENSVKAAAFNTVQRNQIDLSHNDHTEFQMLNYQFSRIYPQGKILQLHGFAQSKRKSQKGKKADFIISNGTKHPPIHLLKTVHCLNQKKKFRVYLYPMGIRELGGTTNSQAKALKVLNFKDFVHIEMSLTWRKLVVKEKNIRDYLFYCMITNTK